MRKIAVNLCFGGFGLSVEAKVMYKMLIGLSDIWYDDIERDDANLIKVIETLGDEANVRHSKLAIVEIPVDVEWHIVEYDGLEHVAENHRTWQ